MQRLLLKSKIHRARVTDANVDYEGSIEIDPDLMDASGLWEGEKVLVASVSKGGRLETYVIEGKRGSKEISINGGAAHVISRGEIIVIMAFTWSEKRVKSKRIFLNEANEIISTTR